jgi:hypothetical protein
MTDTPLTRVLVKDQLAEIIAMRSCNYCGIPKPAAERLGGLCFDCANKLGRVGTAPSE